MQKLKIGQPAVGNGKVSVVIPIYNAAKFLCLCLDSILQQTYTDWEAVLIDDGSTDDSYALMCEYAQKDKRFKLLQQKNQGVAAARNAGLNVAEGKYIAFLDPDDMLYPQFFDVLLKAMLAENADFVWCRSKHCEEKDGLDFCKTYDFYKTRVIKHNLYEQFTDKRAPKLKISCWAKLYRAELLQDLRFSSAFKNVAEDFYFSLCVFGKIKKAVYVHNRFMAYRNNSFGLTKKKYSFQRIDDIITLLRMAGENLQIANKQTAQKLQKMLSWQVFEACCIEPLFLLPESYMKYWEKYAPQCAELAKQKILRADFFSPFAGLLFRLFILHKYKWLCSLLKLKNFLK